MQPRRGETPWPCLAQQTLSAICRRSKGGQPSTLHHWSLCCSTASNRSLATPVQRRARRINELSSSGPQSASDLFCR